MAINTPLTERLQIPQPILLGPMDALPMPLAAR
jgi:hypothetical protein